MKRTENTPTKLRKYMEFHNILGEITDFFYKIWIKNLK